MENRPDPLPSCSGGASPFAAARLPMPEENDDTDHCNACLADESGVCPLHAGERWFASPLDDIDKLARLEDAI